MSTRITLVNDKPVDTAADLDEVGESINRAMRDGQMVRVDDQKGQPRWINPANIVQVSAATRSRAINPNELLNES